jgi:hypothetical protein
MQVLVTDFSPEVAARCMNRLAKLSARFIGNRGFSIGIDDVTPAPLLQSAKRQLMVDGCASGPPVAVSHAHSLTCVRATMSMLKCQPQPRDTATPNCGIPLRYAECETLIMEHKKGILKLSPGMGADETLEAKLQVSSPCVCI